MRFGRQKCGYGHDSRAGRWREARLPAVYAHPGCSLRCLEEASGHQQSGGWGRESVSCLPSPLNIRNLKCSDRALVSAGT